MLDFIKKEILGVGFLRILLALSIIFFHTRTHDVFFLLDGKTAFRTFFLISGFYIALILHKKYGEQSYWLFISNRLLKIFPSLLVVVSGTMIISLFAHFFYHNDLRLSFYFDNFNHINLWTMLIFIFSNITTIGQDILLFFSYNGHGLELIKNLNVNESVVWSAMLAPQSWSLSFEILFYLIAPFIIKGTRKILYSLLAVSIISRLIVYFLFGTNNIFQGNFFLTELSFFLIGIILYDLYLKILDLNLSKIFMLIINFSVLFLVLIFGFIPLDISIKGPVFISLICLALPIMFITGKDSAFDKALGDISYPIFLSQWLMMSFVLSFLNKDNLYFAPLVALLSIVSGVIIYLVIMRPIERVRQERIKYLDFRQTPNTK
ncbi:MAG: acyltransferase [bacterium]